MRRELIKRTLSRWKWGLGIRRITCRPAPPAGPIAFAVMRNEGLRLPAYLDHYRKLGVVRFVILDNRSTDDTRALLAAQEDVDLYASDGHFIGKAPWIDCLLRKHGVGRWCVIADADELLVYPDWPQLDLPSLCHYLERTGANAVHAILLDLYPSGSLSGVDYCPGDDFFSREWYFDPLSSMTKKPRHFHRGSNLDHRWFGGVRQRLFGVAVCCSKFPLLQYKPGMYLNDGHHYLEGGNFSDLRAVVCHFKYLQDFDAHAREEVERGQHVGAREEYQAYADTLAREGEAFRIRQSFSRLWTGPTGLEEEGFLVRPADFETLTKKAATR